MHIFWCQDVLVILVLLKNDWPSVQSLLLTICDGNRFYWSVAVAMWNVPDSLNETILFYGGYNWDSQFAKRILNKIVKAFIQWNLHKKKMHAPGVKNMF